MKKTYRFVNWEIYQSTKSKKWPWIKLWRNLAHHRILDELTAVEFRAFILLLLDADPKTGEFEIGNPSDIGRYHCQSRYLVSCVEKMTSLGVAHEYQSTSKGLAQDYQRTSSPLVKHYASAKYNNINALTEILGNTQDKIRQDKKRKEKIREDLLTSNKSIHNSVDVSGNDESRERLLQKIKKFNSRTSVSNCE